jgi:L-2-hydroxyglutarate oxidase LhgO
MIEVENKSCRGMLVEIILKSVFEKNLFDFVDKLKEIIQEQLNLNLKFETEVSDIENQNGKLFGTVSFKEENDLTGIANFTITSTGFIGLKDGW